MVIRCRKDQEVENGGGLFIDKWFSLEGSHRLKDTMKFFLQNMVMVCSIEKIA